MNKKKWLLLIFILVFSSSACANAIYVKKSMDLESSLERTEQRVQKLSSELGETEVKVAQYITVVKDKDVLIEEQQTYIEDVQSQLEGLKEQVRNLTAK